MRLAEFIYANVDPIRLDWEAKALALLAEQGDASSLALQPHIAGLLQAIAKDVGHDFTQDDSPLVMGSDAAVATCAALRHLGGFSLRQVGAEFRALRMAISQLWHQTNPVGSDAAWRDTAYFHEVMDHALHEYIGHYSDEMARARDGFLSILGHDLRGPLSAITIAGDYLSMPGILDGKPLQAAAGIRSSAASMSAMIKNLMAYAKARLGKKMEVQPQRSDISNICEAVAMKAHTFYPDYSFQVQSKAKVYGDVDPMRLQQVLDNLVEAAIQQGANRQPIALSVHEDQQAIVLQVETCGDAVDLDALQLIVDPAIQIPFDTSEPEKRLAGIVGLGLFTAREIALAHGGRIEVSRADHGGTIFSMYLPHAAQPNQKELSERRWRFA